MNPEFPINVPNTIDPSLSNNNFLNNLNNNTSSNQLNSSKKVNMQLLYAQKRYNDFKMKHMMQFKNINNQDNNVNFANENNLVNSNYTLGLNENTNNNNNVYSYNLDNNTNTANIQNNSIMLSQKQKLIFPSETNHKFNKDDIKTFTLNKEEELRIEVSTNNLVKITLLEGYAEIEGLPLPLNSSIYFNHNKKIAIFCWNFSIDKTTYDLHQSGVNNCSQSKIEVCGKPDLCYIGKETPMISYLSSFSIINELRNEALDLLSVGPRILIMGSTNSGKRTLCNMFINYTLRQGFKCIFADVSLHNKIGIPGSIGATIVDEPIPNDYVIENSLLYFNGSTNIYSKSNTYLKQDNKASKDLKYSEDFYIKQLKSLGNSVNSKLTKDLEAYLSKFKLKISDLERERANFIKTKGNYLFPYSPHEPRLYAAGSIVYCPTYENNQKYIYNHVIDYFKCNIIFVMDNDRLYSSILNDYDSKIKENKIFINKLQKSSGVVNLDSKYKNDEDNFRLVNYFKGPLNNISLKGYEYDINEVKFIQIVDSQIDPNLVTLGKNIDLKSVVKEVHLIENGIVCSNLLGRVFSINHLNKDLCNSIYKNNEYDNLVEEFSSTNTEYFGYIAKININTGKVTVQTPAPYIKFKIFFLGDMRYI